MLTPKQLFETYSQNPCSDYLPSPYSQLGTMDVYGPGPYGYGTPYNFTRIINFLRWVKKPCGSSLWDIDPDEEDANIFGIKNTGANKLAPMYKLLQSLDAGAYTESQHRIRAGTAHSVRNTCDLSRACYLTQNDATQTAPGLGMWNARMATEYLEYFAYNSLPDCLMMCGPDLVSTDAEALIYRAPGYGPPTSNEPYALNGFDDSGAILDRVIAGVEGGTMSCFPHLNDSVPGKQHGCVAAGETTVCKNCGECPKDENGEVIDPNHPCCKNGTMFYYNECCLGGNYQDLLDFSYWIPSDDGSFDGTINGGRIGEKLKHVGLVERRLYNGACNFDRQNTLEKMLMTFPDYFLGHFQGRNGWNYTTSSNIDIANVSTFNPILRARTISLILSTDNGGVLGEPGDVSTIIDTNATLRTVKDLLWNGYGVLLFSNVGFNNFRDSTGLSYPDRIFYTTYSIIGYDDTKTEFNECVYVLHCPFGQWNTGGHPSWGPLPTGAFLVTETILRCMIQYFPSNDFFDCAPSPCTLPIQTRYINNELDEYDPCTEPANVAAAEGCKGEEPGCPPYWCDKEQRSFGMLFAVSLSNNFYKQDKLNIDRFYNYENIRQKIKSQTTTIAQDAFLP